MLALFHMSDTDALHRMVPRPSPPGSGRECELLVWAVDEIHLPNYLLPRDGPRVCWRADGTRRGILSSPSSRVVVIEQQWLSRVIDGTLHVHHLDPDGFTLADESAGYWVSDRTVRVRSVERVHDCAAELGRRGTELRVTPSLWLYIDELTERGGEYSVIRARNAAPRPD